MVSYSPWDHKDSDKTEPLTHTYTHTHTHSVYMSELPSQLLEKGKSKLQWGITSYQSERPSPENLQTIIAGEDVEKREPSWTVSGNVNWLQPLWKTVWGFLKKTRNKSNIWPKNPTPGHIPWENHNSKRYLYPSVHCSNIYSNQDMEAT